ncbi:hypothetical protein psal_cds_281 [Pandoravirus salinus]|uniref:Uncharacterized protein n=1 Tax=Pandoravirus salinus TaxID=1349410 RepID=S4VU44_9VIRU|nr:hypothetical protein psal_cds_281 [Pandoravirus salinus]AGO83868.1 hypothetical protein psal_cds_281 [Pandoravirus salinus]
MWRSRKPSLGARRYRKKKRRGTNRSVEARFPQISVAVAAGTARCFRPTASARLVPPQKRCVRGCFPSRAWPTNRAGQMFARINGPHLANRLPFFISGPTVGRLRLLVGAAANQKCHRQ